MLKGIRRIQEGRIDRVDNYIKASSSVEILLLFASFDPIFRNRIHNTEKRKKTTGKRQTIY